MVVDAAVLAGAGIIGVVGGLGLSLLLRKPRKAVPQAAAGDEWTRLRRLTEERAEAASRQKALQKAYAAHAVEEGAYITKEAHYAKLIDGLDTEIDEVVHRLSGEFLPGEAVKGAEKIRRVSDIGVVAGELGQLKELKNQLEKERDELYVQLSEAEDDRMVQIAEKNALREKYDEAAWRVRALEWRMARAEGEKEEYRERVESYEKAGKLKNLVEENRRLRQGLSRSKDQLSLTKNELAIMEALVDRHAAEIEGKELKTPTQMRELITPTDPDVMGKAKGLGSGPGVFRFIRDNIREVHPHINATYWIRPAEVLRIGGADHEDRMILLCSLLRAIGLDARVVTLEMKNKLLRSVVGLEDMVLDPRRHANWDDYQDISLEGAIRKYAFDGFGVRRAVAVFDDKHYQKL